MLEKRISGQTVFKGHVFEVGVDRVELENGRRAEREIVRHPGGVGILAVDADGRAVLVRQFRYAAGREMLEIPAGRLERGEDPRDAALRELKEETGYSAGECVPLGGIIPTGGYCSERIYLFLARFLTPGTPSPDEGEFVETVPMPLDEVVKEITEMRIDDAKTIAAVFRARAVLGSHDIAGV
ncbi:MAG: NUDIX hydrolase [Oscillospiraceae bacterium]|jgi:ADP-ribose pyrophosphatase|nr:NUDIX hydrolase [Oscillospiraceae bacterium]